MGGNLYVAIVDDYVRVFLQLVAYHQFLKGVVGSDGPSKEELKLRCAHELVNLDVLRNILLDMPGGDKFCARSPHLKNAEVFGVQKCKPDVNIGADKETHRPDIVNFFRPRVAQRTTKPHAPLLPTIIKESFSSVLEVPPPPPTGINFPTSLLYKNPK